MTHLDTIGLCRAPLAKAGACGARVRSQLGSGLPSGSPATRHRATVLGHGVPQEGHSGRCAWCGGTAKAEGGCVGLRRAQQQGPWLQHVPPIRCHSILAWTGIRIRDRIGRPFVERTSPARVCAGLVLRFPRICVMIWHMRVVERNRTNLSYLQSADFS